MTPPLIALPAQPVEDHARRRSRIPLEHHRGSSPYMDPASTPSDYAYTGRLIQRQQAGHRLCGSFPSRSAHARLRQALPMEQPMDLSPIMHLIHPFLPRTDQTAPGSSKTAEPPRTLRPARSAQYSPDVGIQVHMGFISMRWVLVRRSPGAAGGHFAPDSGAQSVHD